MRNFKFAIGIGSLSFLVSCGPQASKESLRKAIESGQQPPTQEETNFQKEQQEPTLAKSENEKSIDTLKIPINSGPKGLSLANAENWQLDMEDRAPVKAIVSEKKHLIVTGELFMEEGAEGEVELGCIEIELYDNVNYREDGWLRVATTGISGAKFEEVKAPLYVDFNPFLRVPDLDDSLDLATFEGNSVKSYKSTQCFMVDLSGLPAQEYNGEIIVQYLKEDMTPEEPAEEPADDIAEEEGDDDQSEGDDASGEETAEESGDDTENEDSETADNDQGDDQQDDGSEETADTSDDQDESAAI